MLNIMTNSVPDNKRSANSMTSNMINYINNYSSSSDIDPPDGSTAG